jgi:hypothetical protein
MADRGVRPRLFPARVPETPTRSEARIRVVEPDAPGNTLRNEGTDAHLLLLGWLPLRSWEHESVDGAVGKVAAALATHDHPLALRLQNTKRSMEPGP